MAVEVLKLLLKNYPKAELCMVESVKDSSFKETQELVKKYDLENKMVFTGILSKNDWHQLSEKYDIFINTTNYR